MAVLSDLKFIILKINDKDVSQMSQNDTVKMFLNTDDSIRLEVRKRKDDDAITERSTTVQIEDGLTLKFANLSFCKKSNSIDVAEGGDSSPTKTGDNGSKSIATQTENELFQFGFRRPRNEIVNCNRVIEQDQSIFEQCLAPELDIEEITLRKSGSNERLGLTVCYSGGSNAGSGTAYGALSGSDENEVSTEVFISDIQADSIAYRDGRLRQGDQILQINGKDLKSKEEAELLIAENNNAVTLLISRYMYTMSFNDPFVTDLDLEENDDDDDDDDDEEEDFYDENNMPYENCFISDNCINVVAAMDPIANDKQTQPENEKRVNVSPSELSSSSNVCTLADSVVDKKAAIDNTPKSEVSGGSQKVSTAGRTAAFKKFGNQKRSHLQNDYDTEHIYETIPEDSESEPLYCSPYESSMYVTAIGSCSSAVTDFEAQPQKHHVSDKFGIATPDPDKQQQVATERNTFNNAKYSFPNNAHNIHSALSLRATERSNGSAGAVCGSHPNDDPDNSSSAYNTGGSNNSVSPLTLVYREKTSTAKEFISTSAACTMPIRAFCADTGLNDNQQKLSEKTMYTNEANLQQTMLMQQHMLRQALSNQSPHAHDYLSATQCPQFTAPNLSQYHFVSSQEVCASKTSCKPSSTIMISQSNTNDEAMVWKVKRRPDGSRYIVRRPVRNNRLVRERLRLSTDRCRNENTTTEEDTISEVKTGRYWSKEDRKKHIEKARERRYHQQHQQQHQYPHQQTNSGVSTMRISDKSTLKIQPNPIVVDPNLNTKPSHMRLSRHNSTKSAQQYYQLQFNTCKGQPMSPAFVNGINSVKMDGTNATYVDSSSAHTRSPMNTAVAASVAQSTATAMGIGVDVADPSALVPSQNYTNVPEANSSNNFLSVTTV